MRHQERIDFIDTYSAAIAGRFVRNGGFDVTVRFVEDQEFSFAWPRRATSWSSWPMPRSLSARPGRDRICRTQVQHRRLEGAGDAAPPRSPGQRHPHAAGVSLQFLLLLLALPLLLAGLALSQLSVPWWQAAVGGGLACVLAFLVSGLPFGWKAWRKDGLPLPW